MWEMRRWKGMALPCVLKGVSRVATWADSSPPSRESYPSSLCALFRDGQGIGSEGKAMEFVVGERTSWRTGMEGFASEEMLSAVLARAALALVTETVGDAFLITGNLKWTLRERVVKEFVLDERGFGEAVGEDEKRSCMLTGRAWGTCRTTTSAARGARGTKKGSGGGAKYRESCRSNLKL